MGNPPFTTSVEALSLIQEVFHKAEAERPDLAKLARRLGFAFSSASSSPTPEGGWQVTSLYSQDHFRLGWRTKGGQGDHQYVEWDLGGVKVDIHEDTLERLKGKKLVVETVEAGYPNPADHTVRLLKAI